VLTLVLSLALAAEPEAPLAAPPPDEATQAAPVDGGVDGPVLAELPVDQEEKVSRKRVNAVLFASGSAAIGAGVALASWFDRDGTFGRVAAITGGVFGLGMLAASVGGLIARLIHEAQTPPENPVAAGFDALGAAITQALVAGVSGLVGMVAGGVIAGVTSTQPGVPRGVTGIAGGGLMALTGVAVAIAVW
jgi:hypothetical protein